MSDWLRRCSFLIPALMPCLGLMICLSLGACAPAEEHEHEEDEAWAVTAWGEQFEIFAEADPMVVGETVKSHTHVTMVDEL